MTSKQDEALHKSIVKTVSEAIKGRQLWTVKGNQTLAEAAILMRQHGIHRLPVIDNQNKLVGLLSVSDLRAAADSPVWHKDEILSHLQKVNVETVMKKVVQTCEPSDRLVDVAKLLRVSDINGMPVVQPETKHVIGVISRSDILDEFIRVLEPL